jgi:hypothetical protein
MPTEIEQIEDLIIIAVKNGIPELNKVESWPDKMNLKTLLEENLTTPACFVIHAGEKYGEKKTIGANNSNDEQIWRLTLIVESIRSRQDGAKAGYAFIAALVGDSTTPGILKGMKLTPLRGYLWPVSSELLSITDNYYAYGLEFIRRTY